MALGKLRPWKSQATWKVMMTCVDRAHVLVVGDPKQQLKNGNYIRPLSVELQHELLASKH